MSHGNKGRHVSTAAMMARDQLENMQTREELYQVLRYYDYEEKT